MFFFYPVHDENQTKTPAVNAEPHILVVFQSFPVCLVSPATMNVLDNHHRVVIFENQWIIVYESF